MRRSIIAAAFTAAASVACSSNTTCDGYCGTIVVLSSANVSTLFPPRITVNDEQAVAEQIFGRLAELTTDLETAGDSGFVPELASRWIREDDVTLVFELHPEARWHDGTPVTAEDVVFTFDLFRDEAVGATAAVLLERIHSVTARDARTVEFRFVAPYLEQLYDAAHHAFILPKHALDTIPPDSLATHPLMTRHPIGSGPYRVARWGEDGTIELVADTNYFLGRPGIPRIIFRTVNDFGAKITALAAHDGDFVDFLGGAALIERIEQTEDVRVIPYPSPAYNYLGFNFRSPVDTTKPHPLLADARVRRALAMVVDPQAVNAVTNGRFGTVARGPVPPMIRLANLEYPTLPHDTARARTLLREAGWADANGDGVLDRDGIPFAFEILYPSTSGIRRTTGIALEEAFRNFGFQIDLNAVDFPTFQERQRAGQFDAFLGSQFTSPNPGSVKTAWITGGTFNFGRYSNPRFDAAVDRAVGATTRELERRAWQEAFQLLNEDAPAVWLYHPGMNAGIHTRFENVTIRPDSWSVTLWTWRVRPGEWEPRDLVGSS